MGVSRSIHPVRLGCGVILSGFLIEGAVRRLSRRRTSVSFLWIVQLHIILIR